MLNVKKDDNKKNIKKEDRIRFSNNDLLYQYILEIAIKKDLDFIAFAVSHWHAAGVDSAIYDISQRKNKKPNGLIIIDVHPKDGFVVEKKDFICKNFAEVEFYFLDSNLNNLQNQRYIIFRIYKAFKKLINILRAIMRIRIISKNKKNNSKELFIISVMNPNISFLEIFKNKYISNKYIPVYFIIDEGFSTYISKKAWEVTKELDNQDTKFGHFNYLEDIETKIKTGIMNNILKRLVIKYINIENRFLFKLNKGKLIPNFSVVNSYKSIFLKRKEILLKFDNVKNILSPAIIITKPFSEYKLANLKYELEILDKTVSILIRKGYSVIIKPHPRESDNKYVSILKNYKSNQVKITHKDFPVEDLFATINPLCVIGYTSTALLTANIIFDFPAISIYPIFLSNNVSKKKYIRKIEYEGFEKFTKGLIYNINSFEQLESKLKVIKY